MLELLSWTTYEIEPAFYEKEVERSEKEKEKEPEKTRTLERKFKQLEKCRDLPKALEKPMERFVPKNRRFRQATSQQKLSCRVSVRSKEQPRVQKMATTVALQTIPRQLPKALCRPFQPTKTVIKSTHQERALRKESGTILQKIQVQQPEQALFFLHSYLDQKQESKKGTSSCPKPRSFKQLSTTSDKPFLVRPKVGIFALYYILTKIGLISDSKSHFDTKTEVQLNQIETEKTHQERLLELKKVIDDSKSTERWAAAYQVMSWFTNFSGVVTGITLLMTGTAPIAGALLLCGGLISVTNQLLQMSDTWVHIAKKLPGTPEEKHLTIKWMQIGITVLALILTGAGVVFGGFTEVQLAFGVAQSMTGGVLKIGTGALNFGEAVFRSRQKGHEAEIRRHQKRLVELRHRREDIDEAVEASVFRMEKLFEDLAQLLEFDRELFKISEAINR